MAETHLPDPRTVRFSMIFPVCAECPVPTRQNTASFYPIAIRPEPRIINISD
jgi:hypothetical protein